jgi:uncharacterized delta-60 repeat protein
MTGFRCRFQAILLFALLTPAAGRAVDGDLDVGFHGDGRLVFHDVAATYFSSYALNDAPDGAVVSAGSTSSAGVQRASWSRFTRTTVGATSCALDVAGADWSRYLAAEFDPSGRLLVAGEADFAGTRKGVIAAYLYPACTLDPQFGADDSGYVLAGFIGDYQFTDLVTVYDTIMIVGMPVLVPRIVGVGTLSYQSGPEFVQDVMLWGYQLDGDADTRFGDGGFKIQDLQPEARDSGDEIARAPGNRLVVLAFIYDYGGPALVYLDADGELIPYDEAHPGWRTVDLGGPATFDVGLATALRVTPEGDVVLGGEVLDEDSLVQGVAARFRLPTLLLDTTFGAGGRRHFACLADEDTNISALAVASDGSVVLGGAATASSSNAPFCVARLTPAGDLDPTFGSGGMVTHSAVIESEGGADTVRLTLAGGRPVLTAMGYSDEGPRRVLAISLQTSLIFADSFEAGSLAGWAWMD